MVGLVVTLTPLTILRIGWVGWVPLRPLCTLVPAVTSVLYYASDNMVSSSITLTNTVVMIISISQLDAFYVTSTSSPLASPPIMYQVRVPTPATVGIILPRVSTHIIPCPTVAD